MATITFKTKIIDGAIMVPLFKKSHCDMKSFRLHPVYGPYANSDLFNSVLKRIWMQTTTHGVLWIDKLPSNVTIKEKGYLTTFVVDV